MLILAIDSAGAGCGVCVWRDGQVLSRAVEAMARGQDARLMPMIVEAMARAKVAFSDLDKIAVTRGPGSFTGLRVGLAAARGIGLAAAKPVVGIDRFALYRATQPAHRDGLVVIDSRRADLFCRFFPAVGAAHAASLMTQDDIDAFVAAHPDALIAGDMATPDVDAVTTAAVLAAPARADDPAFAPSPFYLRAPDVSFSKAR